MIARGIVLIVAIIICTTVGRATVVDLTGSNDSGTINGAQFVFTTPQPTGTGVIQPFSFSSKRVTRRGVRKVCLLLPWKSLFRGE